MRRPRNWYPVPHHVGFEFDAGVVDVKVHPSWISFSWSDLGGHFRRRSHASRFGETLERSPDVVLGRTAFVALYDETERFLLSVGGHVHSLYLV